MSRYIKNEITCPSCGHSEEEKIWESVNASMNPEMKESIMNHDFFVYTCPKCGTVTPLAYNCLYSDIKKKEMIWLIPEIDEKILKEVNEAKTIEVNGEVFGTIYLDRVVTTPNELVEKILIFDEGYDDRILEIMKLIYMSQLGSLTGNDEIMQIPILEMLFDAKDGEHSFVLFFEGRNPMALNFNEELYIKLYEDYIEKAEEITKAGYQQIDYQWAKKLLTETNAKGSMKKNTNLN